MTDAAAALWPRGSGVRLTENYNLEGLKVLLANPHGNAITYGSILRMVQTAINQDSDF